MGDNPVVAIVALVLLVALIFYAGWPGTQAPLDNPTVLVLEP